MTQHLQSHATSRNAAWEQALMRCGRRRVVDQQSREREKKVVFKVSDLSVRADAFADGFQSVCASNDEGLLGGYTQRSRTFLIATTPTQHHHRESITATIRLPRSRHPIPKCSQDATTTMFATTRRLVTSIATVTMDAPPMTLYHTHHLTTPTTTTVPTSPPPPHNTQQHKPHNSPWQTLTKRLVYGEQR